MRAEQSGAEFVDAALFLGMNSADERTRIACKSYFAARLTGRVTMSLEQVGRCDDLVWRFPRQVQDAYYPFMDVLHTDMAIDRVPYEAADLSRGLAEETGLPMHERLLLAMVRNRRGTLRTVSPRLLGGPDGQVLAPPAGPELAFPEPLEGLYQQSLVLRLPVDAL
ncbi:DUF6190 family protein [Kitasatospora viridis]|uniref:Uncharacterized protein n=1 Tax=Kitasatospora viridis TaxID=281105 RepID=A0A561UPC3_9ACTN|nr:DUF6190 family protein [Kitasatospora viridis]TWG01205.1 hypothetical protein FHX73_115097 [Kitasatospora viridis]